MKRIVAYILAILLLLTGCHLPTRQGVDGVCIELSDDRITVDGRKVTHNPSAAVYTANDIVFYLAGQDFTYGEGEEKDGHKQSEADAHTVVHITKPGKYVLSGSLSAGQIAVDLGEDAKEDPEAVVTLVLNGVDVTCTVAPAVIFYNVYECGEKDEKATTTDIDTSKAGANVIIADGTENTISGSYVARIYDPESVILSEDKTKVEDADKLHKYDAAFYSKRTMNIGGGEKGDGILNINAENEGLDSELHLTVNGGVINITSGNDGINTNEDNVSVTTINGGTLTIRCDGKTGEGDGIDSNGWLVINGGAVIAQACATSGDAGVDSDKGIYINGGSVVATGNMLDRIAGGERTYAVFQFASRQIGGSVYSLKDKDGKTVAKYTPANDFTYLLVAGEELIPGDYTFYQGDTQLAAATGGKGNVGERPQTPQGEEEQTAPQEPNGEFPQVPDGVKPEGVPPEQPNGEKPDGLPPEPPNGQRPTGDPQQTPNGDEFQFPNGFGGQGMTDVELTSMFTIVKGGNQFVSVTPVSAE